MERNALCPLRAPSKLMNSARLHALPVRGLNAVSRRTYGHRRDSRFFAAPLWVGCKSSASGESPAQKEPDDFVPSQSYLAMNLVEAFRQPPEVTAAEAPAEPEYWPAKGYKATKFDSKVTEQFFNRRDELKFVRTLITGTPDKVILLLGPPNCGKTALLEELMKKDQARFLHLNCGLETVTSSNLMAQALRERASKLPAAVGVALRSLPAISKFSWFFSILPASWWEGFPSVKVDKGAVAAPSKVYDLVSDLFSENKDTNLTYVINAYKKVLVENVKPEKKPVFIIDESNVLRNWRKTAEEAENLNGLLNFFQKNLQGTKEGACYFGHF